MGHIATLSVQTTMECGERADDVCIDHTCFPTPLTAVKWEMRSLMFSTKALAINFVDALGEAHRLHAPKQLECAASLELFQPMQV